MRVMNFGIFSAYDIVINRALATEQKDIQPRQRLDGRDGAIGGKRKPR